MKIKWKVGEEPTGRYRSFSKWLWPKAEYSDGEACAIIYCADSYAPWRVRECNHAPLEVRIADHSMPSNPEKKLGFTWRVFKKKCATLAEAKELVASVLAKHPEFSPKKETASWPTPYSKPPAAHIKSSACRKTLFAIR